VATGGDASWGSQARRRRSPSRWNPRRESASRCRRKRRRPPGSEPMPKRASSLDTYPTPSYESTHSVAPLRKVSDKGSEHLSDMDRNNCPNSSECAIGRKITFFVGNVVGSFVGYVELHITDKRAGCGVGSSGFSLSESALKFGGASERAEARTTSALVVRLVVQALACPGGRRSSEGVRTRLSSLVKASE
jgi:hypothetical protein